VKFGRIPGPHNDIHLDSYIEWLPKRWANNWLALPQNASLDFALAPILDKTADNIDFATKHVSKSKINRNSVENSLSFSRYTISNWFNPNTARFTENPIPDEQYSMFNYWTTPYDIIGVTTMPDTYIDLSLMILMADEERVLFCLTLHNITSDYVSNRLIFKFLNHLKVV